MVLIKQILFVLMVLLHPSFARAQSPTLNEVKCAFNWPDCEIQQLELSQTPQEKKLRAQEKISEVGDGGKAVTKSRPNQCGAAITDFGLVEIRNNKAWAGKFRELDCAVDSSGKPKGFHLGQLGSDIEKNIRVQEIMKICGMKNLTQWKYPGNPTRNVCQSDSAKK